MSLNKLNDHPLLCGSGCPLAIVKVRNEIERLPQFMAHYRSLGLQLFLFIDNDSTDGTRTYLLEQPDVVIFHTTAEFGAGWRNWISGLLTDYAGGRWVLIVDADEILVLPCSGANALAVFLNELEKEAADAVIATMVDMYSDRPIRETALWPGGSLMDACPYFDPGPYLDWTRPAARPPVLYAGVRERVFWPRWRRSSVGWRRILRGLRHRVGRVPLLAHWRDPTDIAPPYVVTCPLIKWGPDKVFSDRHGVENVHVSKWLLALLHFKFLSDFYAKVDDAVASGQYFRGSCQYRVYQRILRENPNLSLHGSMSVRYTAADSLVNAGLMVVPPTKQRVPNGPLGEHLMEA